MSSTLHTQPIAPKGTETVDPWMTAMRRGDFDAAWKISDRILQHRCDNNEACWHWPRHQQFIWRGESLIGKRVLVRCYHGLGDTLQFCRFAAPLRRLAREVIVWVQPILLPLITTVPGIDRCLPLHDGTADVAFDVDIELMELPHALRINVRDLPGAVPYIHVTHEAGANVLRAGDKRNVGVVWQAGDWNLERSLSIDDLKQLSGAENVKFFSLQYPADPAGVTALGATDISCRDVALMAARMLQLDLIISVDTMAAHLAGALGRPTWVLLNQQCDWRWMDARADSPWYPTMRLFRQQQAGVWKGVVDEVLSELSKL